MPITPVQTFDNLLAVANSFHRPESRQEGEATGSEWLPAHDHLESPDEAERYFRRHGIRFKGSIDRRHLAALKQFREAAQAFSESRRRYERLTGSLLEAARFRLTLDGQLVSIQDGWDGFIDGLLIPLLEMRNLSDRIKRCHNQACGWLFLDQSKNRSRQWCESASCGNRQRVRRYRERLEAAS